MRLLNAKTHDFQEFYEDDLPSYVILSHTWGNDEVLFRDIEQSNSLESYKAKRGWAKIDGCCKQALNDGLEYVWIDTCCIDKSSSAELQEAINSMFRWYEMSQVCYAYLVDVPPGEDPAAQGSSFRRSRWFQRGWTLQELIAPTLVRFVDQSWAPLGTRYRLCGIISEITGIKPEVLVTAAFGARQAIRAASVAQKMSWAANRRTSRLEDMAYSLLGIFEINMPLIYGEGSKAFQRLQEEIIKISGDQTILAWGFKQAMPGLWGTSSALAKSPSDFAACSELEFYGVANSDDHFTMSQKGLQLHLPTVDHLAGGITYCLLRCGIPDRSTLTFPCLAVPLLVNRSVVNSYNGPPTLVNEYSRMSLKTPVWVSSLSSLKATSKTIFLPRVRTRERSTRWRIDVKIENAHNLPRGMSIRGIYPPALTADDLVIFSGDHQVNQVLIQLNRPQKTSVLLIMRCQTKVGYTRKHFATIDIELPTTFNDIGSYAKELVRQIVWQFCSEGFSQSLSDVEVDRMSLAELGVDSLTSMSIVLFLRGRTGLPLDLSTFTDCHTLRDIERKLVVLLNSQVLVDEVRNTIDLEEREQWRRWRSPTLSLQDSVRFGVAELNPEISLLDLATDNASWDHLGWQDAALLGAGATEGTVPLQWEARLPWGGDEELLISFPDPLQRSPDTLPGNRYDLRLDIVSRKP